MSNKTLTLMMGLVAFLILAVGAVFLVVALGGSGDDDSQPADGSTQKTPGASGTSTGSTAKICESKVLIVPGDEPLAPFDPILVGDESTAAYIVEIFGGLVTLDRNLKVVPDIAESWTVSPDGLVYTFKLRGNALFHDNTRVTANDFKYSLERAADPANASPTVKAYLGRIKGLEDKLSGKATDVSGVKVVDAQTLEITLAKPEPVFIQELTYPVAFVVKQSQIEQDPRNWTRKPIGTGPFKIVEFSPAEKIRLVRNDRYHLGAPLLEEVVFELGGGSISTRYQNDEIHIGFVPALNLKDIEDGKSDLSKEYVPVPQMAVSYITLNPNQAPFDDLKVRQALAMSVDKASINDVLLYGYYRVADGILPPDMPGYKESVSGFKYDIDAAKKLLSESKYAGNFPRIILTYGGSGGNSPETLVAIQDGWTQLGLDVQLQAVDSAALLREQRRGTFQALSEGWIADYPDPGNFIEKLFGSDSPLNYTKYQNADVDRLIERASAEPDDAKRADLYTQAEQLILNDAVTIPMFWPVEHTLIKSCVVNYPSVSMAIPKYRYIDIDPTK
ncbi:MAG: peptide ABC transporter substrate-binding protein [Dehalococcoidia bacterium]|nr:peptide ABC transporter substrate-binding protein [Dehalococcoidia bacterium]MCB9484784.1 peptide ABC transporter substrate-binding protein [Thermoflexaceae bacterium]